MPKRAITVVVPTRDTREMTLACLDSVSGAAGSLPLDLVVVDDGSRDGSAGAIAERHPEARILRNEEPTGFSAAASRGLAAGTGDPLLLLNSDARIESGTLRPVGEAFEADPRLGIVGASLRFPDGRPQWSGGPEPSIPWLFVLTSGIVATARRRRLGGGGFGVSGHRRGRIEWVPGAAMAIRREAWARCGPFDPRYVHYCQDLDLCVRVRREGGWTVRVLTEPVVIHELGGSVDGSSVDGQRLDLLWCDLARWAEVHRSEAWRRLAVRAMRLGGLLRRAVVARSREEKRAVERALEALDDLRANIRRRSS